MNKLELIKKICEKTEQKQNEVDATLKAFASVIIEEVRDGGEDVQIPGVGIFKQKVNPAHTCRNPFNGNFAIYYFSNHLVLSQNQTPLRIFSRIS